MLVNFSPKIKTDLNDKPGYKIEEAIESDYQTIAEIYNECIASGTATMDSSLKSKQDIADWVLAFNDREKLFVLKEDGTNVGWGIIKRYSDREGYRFTCETAVYLTASKTALGYGTLMKQHIISVCKELKYKHLVAKIWANNQVSIDYNLKLGYTIVGTQKQIGFKNNEWIDVVILQYIIT